MTLKKYHSKRDFKHTPEPKGKLVHDHQHIYVIQKHAASHLHYDFRLELNGVLLSWAIPKGPCFDPKVKRLAMHVEDHPVAYGGFEGIIPKGQYGGGTVMLWDKGYWEPLDKTPNKAYQEGHLRFNLHANKLHGRWDLLRFKDDKHWFLIKYADDYAQPLKDYDVTEALPNSVFSEQTMDEIAVHRDRVWKGVSAKHTGKKYVPALIQLPPNLPTVSFPNFIKPQLATLVDKAPEGPEWLHELKFDGYRILALIEGKKIILKSRNNNDWTKEFMSVAAALKKLKCKKAVFDGEVVVLDKEGRSNFQLLQNAINSMTDVPFIYFVFDILYYDGIDLRPLPLLQRKEILKKILAKADATVRYSDHLRDNGSAMLKKSCELSLEGIISKRIDQPYLSKRSGSWLKIKCLKRQEFVVCGYSHPQGSRERFGALYLGFYDKSGHLQYAGNVGTGFTSKSLQEIHELLKVYGTQHSPFQEQIPAASQVNWVKPVLVAEVEFSQWTDDNHVRHPSFKGLRLDKKAKEVVREQEMPTHKVAATMISRKPKAKSFTITHPEKILYQEDEYTKADLLEYYQAVSDLIIPLIKNRPLSLVRCPENYKHCFFQRHFTNATPKALHSVLIETKEGEEDYIYLNNKTGLFSLVQMGVLEIHPWGSKIAHIEYPDFIVFDLDPAPDVTWKEVVAAAREIKEHLQGFKLTSFVKTTGGKGLHVVVPIKPEYDWDAVKNFTHVFVQFLEQSQPDKYISKMSKAKRNGKIFVDYLRNLRGATAIGPYSTRSRIHAPVSTPIHWDELTNNKNDTEFNIKSILTRLATLSEDPWQSFNRIKQSLRLDSLN